MNEDDVDETTSLMSGEVVTQNFRDNRNSDRRSRRNGQNNQITDTVSTFWCWRLYWEISVFVLISEFLWLLFTPRNHLNIIIKNHIFPSSVSRLIFKDCSVSGLYQLHLDTPSVVLSARVPCKLPMYWKEESSSLFRTKTRLCLIMITLETEMVTLLSYPVNAYSKLPFLENQRNVHSEFP